MVIVPPFNIPLTQGDIFDDCPLVSFETVSNSSDLGLLETQVWRSRVIVLTQACDLAQIKTTKVVVARIFEAQWLVDEGLLKSASIRDQIRRHQVFGWYFLPALAVGAIPESLIDFRELYTLPRTILESLAQQGKRVASLLSPYREHLAQHFAVTYMRIALPEPFPTAP